MNNKSGTAAAGFAVLLGAMTALASEASAQRTFATPQAAAEELIAAARAGRPGFVNEMFGPTGRALVNAGDAENDARRVKAFVDAASEKVAIEDQDANTRVLVIGKQNFPFPVPIARKGDVWAFDPTAGRREIRARLIGHNEIAAAAACSAYMAAQKDYIRQDRDDDRVLEYAQRIVSSRGARDGLYWEGETQADISPLEGALSDAIRSARGKPSSYEGYVFRILKRQGPAAPGGAYNYVINGNMIGGHALIAYPEKWGETGVMTFMCSHHGEVFEKNLGRFTSRAATRIDFFNPDKSWDLVD